MQRLLINLLVLSLLTISVFGAAPWHLKTALNDKKLGKDFPLTTHVQKMSNVEDEWAKMEKTKALVVSTDSLEGVKQRSSANQSTTITIDHDMLKAVEPGQELEVTIDTKTMLKSQGENGEVLKLTNVDRNDFKPPKFVTIKAQPDNQDLKMPIITDWSDSVANQTICITLDYNITSQVKQGEEIEVYVEQLSGLLEKQEKVETHHRD